ILRRTHNMVNQGRDVVPFMPIVAHASDNNTAAKAEASFEESDPRDSMLGWVFWICTNNGIFYC
ncbi:MAG TPA: hypothetical protein VFC02_24340, partial [Anaerolineales bacterium]|nr:hypothetical protein [Anaerolineales bacterium]